MTLLLCPVSGQHQWGFSQPGAGEQSSLSESPFRPPMSFSTIPGEIGTFTSRCCLCCTCILILKCLMSTPSPMTSLCCQSYWLESTNHFTRKYFLDSLDLASITNSPSPPLIHKNHSQNRSTYSSHEANHFNLQGRRTNQMTQWDFQIHRKKQIFITESLNRRQLTGRSMSDMQYCMKKASKRADEIPFYFSSWMT